MAAPKRSPKRAGARGGVEQLMARRQKTRLAHKDVAKYAVDAWRKQPAAFTVMSLREIKKLGKSGYRSLVKSYKKR
jgi:hypothetical protein